MQPPQPAPLGIDVDALERWLVDHVDGATAPFGYELIAAGGSNLTYRVTDGAGVVRVLRRPPVGRALESAHDMHREARIMRALGAAGEVAVPAILGTCDDADVTGASFTVMAFVDGVVLRTQADAAGLDAADASRATDALVDAQVALHTLDLQAAGLADLGRHDGYVARQLARWQRQLALADLRPLPLAAELHDRLAASLPPERVRPALAHGDLRFDNVILTPELTTATVLDWELCTTGDPIADFAWSLRYWAEAGDSMHWLIDAPTLAPPFAAIGRAEVARRYQERTGFDLSDLGWFEVFSWWKQACIVEGVHARRRRGMTAGMDATAADDGEAMARLDAIGDRVDTMLAVAHGLAADALP